jgi:Zn-dependent protease with chaperone function
MIDLDCVLTTCLEAFMGDPLGTFSIVLVGTLTLISTYFIVKKRSVRSKIRWSYPLVFSLLFLLTYYAFSMMCHQALPLCAEHAIMYSIPAGLIGAILFGYVIIPHAYKAWTRMRFSEKISRELPEYAPVYIADKGKPFAFSYGGFRKWIVVSQGMIDILTKRELQAVLLHEYGHLVNNSSFYKSSNWIYSKIPVLHAFLDGKALEDEEEREADMFAIKTQGTSRYLNSAKRKIVAYFNC